MMPWSQGNGSRKVCVEVNPSILTNCTRNTSTQQPLAQGNGLRMQIFAFSHFSRNSRKPPVMATLNQFNSNLFVISVNNSPLAKKSQYIGIDT